MRPVSIAMATYNGQRHIRRQLESLAAQNHIPAELVVSDDMSDDDTIAVIDAFAKTASFPVRVHRNDTRLGFRENFMRAASLCRSELIAFCDQDDCWYPDKIAKSVEAFSDPEVLLAYHNADVVTLEGRRIGSLAARVPKRPVLTPLSSAPWLYALGFTVVFRQSLLPLSSLWLHSRNVNDSSQPAGHDHWFFFLASVFGKIVYLDEPLAAYVQHGGNAYGWTEASFLDSIRFFFRNRADGISRQARAAESRALVLATAKGSLGSDWSDRAVAGAEYYGRLSLLNDLRGSLYTSANLRDRLSTFGTILRKSGYAGAWSLGYKAFIADLCLGVPIGPLLPR